MITIDDILSMSRKELKDFFINYQEHSKFYKEAVDMAEEMRVHGDGIYPEKLIDSRRPNESDEVKKYRKDISIPKTKPTFERILLLLNKIRRSQEWSIRYTDESKWTRIPDDEKLSSYCEYNYPGFTSITNWTFSILLKKYLIDPNSIVFIKPDRTDIEPNDFYKPIATVFGSEDVVYFLENEICILKDPEGYQYLSNGKRMKGLSFIVITTMAIYRFAQVNSKIDFELLDEFTFEHNLGILPAFKIQANVKDQYGNQILYETKLSGMVPELNEAVREYSDLQAAKVLHVYPERYEFTNTECPACKGTGKTLHSDDDHLPDHHREEVCSRCNGAAYVVSGPFAKHMIKPAGIDEQQIPNPPIGYVTKDITIVELQEKSVDAHIYSGLSAVNLEMVARVPINESGIAKAYDGDASNNTLHSIGEDIVHCMDRHYYITAKYRYSVQYPSDEDVRDMLPSINVPERFDIATSGMLEKEISAAKTSKINPEIINRLEIEYANKRFYNEPDALTKLTLILELDPLANISIDDKNSMLMNKGISQIDYVTSCNISPFIERAIAADEKFVDMEVSAQKELLRGYANELISASSMSTDPMFKIDDSSNDDNQTTSDDEAGDEDEQMFRQPTNALRESVGGLTAMIEIAKAVGSGAYPLDAAIALIADRFGITEEAAARQLGKPIIKDTDIEKVGALT